MKKLLPALAMAVVARMAFHAVFLPAFEGPDEPHHLARVMAFVRGPLPQALAGGSVGADVVAAVRAYPCAPALGAAYGCPPFGKTAGAFDLLRAALPMAPDEATVNPESNQPPLFYAAAGLPLRLAWPGAGAAGLLLYCRLFSVGLVALAILGPLALLARSRPPGLAVAGLLALLLPGASESLARCSNDAAVFLWAALVLALLDDAVPSRRLALLFGAGPLLKLTAIPVVVFAVVALFVQGRRRAAVVGAACSLSVFPVQLWRGWLWGGTVELNRATAPISEPLLRTLVGFTRSVYAFVKTTFWVGGWSLLRPPGMLAALYLLLLFAALLAWRLRARPRRPAAHAAAMAMAAAGFCVFALANRRLYRDWGGIGGWYLWDWSPWLAMAASDLGSIAPRAGVPLLWLEGLFVLAANAFWLSAHGSLYVW